MHVHATPNHQRGVSVMLTNAERAWLTAWVEAAIAAERGADKIKNAKLGLTVLKKLRQA
jgi:hypothetical protein